MELDKVGLMPDMDMPEISEIPDLPDGDYDLELPVEELDFTGFEVPKEPVTVEAFNVEGTNYAFIYQNKNLMVEAESKEIEVKPEGPKKKAVNLEELNPAEKFVEAKKKLFSEIEEEINKVPDEAKKYMVWFYENFRPELLQLLLDNHDLPGQILQEHKSWQRCMKYVRDKLAKPFMDPKTKRLDPAKMPGMMGMDSSMLHPYILEYYAMDDKAQIEKEKKEAEKKKKQQAETDARIKKAQEESKKRAEKKTAEKKAEAQAKKAEVKAKTDAAAMEALALDGDEIPEMSADAMSLPEDLSEGVQEEMDLSEIFG